MSALFRLMAVLIEEPWLAVVPGLAFLALQAASRHFLVLTAALAWLAYVPYEYGMKLRILCTGECNIRVDLLLLYPALLVASLAALAVSATAAWKRRG